MCCGRSAAIRFLRLGTDVDSTLSRFPAAYCPSSFTSFLEACTRADAVAEVLPRQSAVALPARRLARQAAFDERLLVNLRSASSSPVGLKLLLIHRGYLHIAN